MHGFFWPFRDSDCRLSSMLEEHQVHPMVLDMSVLEAGLLSWQCLPSSPSALTSCLPSRDSHHVALNIRCNVSFMWSKVMEYPLSIFWKTWLEDAYFEEGKFVALFSSIPYTFYCYFLYSQNKAAENLGWRLLCWIHCAHLYFQAQALYVYPLQPPNASRRALLTLLHSHSSSTNQ